MQIALIGENADFDIIISVSSLPQNVHHF